jgi:hypothetical protein
MKATIYFRGGYLSEVEYPALCLNNTGQKFFLIKQAKSNRIFRVNRDQIQYIEVFEND